jgi:hypothetical protein
MMPRRLRFLKSLAPTLALLLIAAGCSNLPTKPLGTNESESSAIATEVASSEVLGLNLHSDDSNQATTKRVIVGLLGGIVSAGDFTLVIPPAAITGTVTVTVSQPDLDHPIVNLSISPASANRFRLPVLMIANAKRMDHSLIGIAEINYYNPATGQWERVPGSSVSILNLTVTAPLMHFSTYRVGAGGKAGW